MTTSPLSNVLPPDRSVDPPLGPTRTPKVLVGVPSSVSVHPRRDVVPSLSQDITVPVEEPPERVVARQSHHEEVHVLHREDRESTRRREECVHVEPGGEEHAHEDDVWYLEELHSEVSRRDALPEQCVRREHPGVRTPLLSPVVVSGPSLKSPTADEGLCLSCPGDGDPGSLPASGQVVVEGLTESLVLRIDYSSPPETGTRGPTGGSDGQWLPLVPHDLKRACRRRSA